MKHADRSTGGFAGLRGAAARFHAHQGGQAIYIVVMYMFLLLGLLLLVINSGEKVNHKIEMQGAADSVATTGAAWYARGLNVASMCNVGELQLLSTINLCDTLETVTPAAVENIDRLHKDVPIDLRLTDPNASSPDGNMFLVAGNAATEQQAIHQFADIVQAISWPRYLNYSGGVLWDCMTLLDGFSHAMIRDTPRAACREAADIAKKNHADFGFMTPFWPKLPIEIGVFQDFKDPMRLGRMPQRLLGRRIGGFRWGVMNYQGYGSTFLDDRDSLRHIGGSMGPWSFWREPFVESRPMGLFDLSGFGDLFNAVSSMKFEMLFGNAEDKASLRNWSYNYDEAKALSVGEIRRTWWESVTFYARYVDNEEMEPFPPPASGAWTAKKWGVNSPYLYPSTSTVPNRSPWPPNPSPKWPSVAGYTRATEGYQGADPRSNVWYRVQRQSIDPKQMGSDLYRHLGIPTPPHAPPYTADELAPYAKTCYWRVTMLRFNGAELAPDTALHRQYMPALGQTPDIAPTFLKLDEGDNTMECIEGPNGLFTFNGYAYRAAKATNWTQRFINPNPTEAVVCYAQARVFNPASWDLFTQAWRVKLMRTETSYNDDRTHDPRWGVMLSELKKGIPSQAAQTVDGLNEQHVKPVLETIESYTAEFVREVTH